MRLVPSPADHAGGRFVNPKSRGDRRVRAATATWR